MKTRILVTLLTLIPGIAFADTRSGDARVGVNRMSLAASRSPSMVTNLGSSKGTNSNSSNTTNTSGNTVTNTSGGDSGTSSSGGSSSASTETESSANTNIDRASCREKYRACMDEFCLLDESEGSRCACSSNINKSKSLILEIQNIQEEADKLYTEEVERASLGARAKYIFGESAKAQKSSKASGMSFAQWLSSSGDVANSGELGSDANIGDGLFAMASGYCAADLEACGDRGEMEEALYSRMVVQDCKAFDTYLKEQKTNALANKRTAESAVRKAKMEVFGQTNKYNRGECLLAYRSCIADKGGCGSNFENCLDKDLLGRRANACENILDQCMGERDYVLKDWEAESESILEEAHKYAEKNSRATCLARIQVCLEDNCSTSTNSACLEDVNVAAGICPVIDECEEKITGIKNVVNNKLGYLKVQFCQNDVDKCLRSKCGENFTAPECVGKSTTYIASLCPQKNFPTCNATAKDQFDIIVNSAMLQMDYQKLQGCLNYFSEQLGKVCGTDMSCLPANTKVSTITEIPEDEAGLADLRKTVTDESKTAVDEFFKQFEQDKTVSACKSGASTTSGKDSGAGLGDKVFTTAKQIAYIGAENRAIRELDSKIAELSRKQDAKKAEENCKNTYKVEDPNQAEKKGQNYSYIRSVSYEPDVRNCHVCRMQQTCEISGESKFSAATKLAAGGLTAGAATGTTINAGWGTAIGGAVGLVGGLIGGAAGYKDPCADGKCCMQIESCEDINM